MASRGGARAAGTDGNDFLHREKVAGHYQASSAYKTRMKFAILLHFVLFLFMLAKVSCELLEHAGVQLPESYVLGLPKALLWEWLWMISICFSALSFFAIRKNKILMMKLSASGILVFGVFPIIVAAVQYLGSLIVSLQSSSAVEKYKGIPIAFLWYGFIGIAFQVHLLSIVFALKLIEAWSPKQSKKSN